MSFFASPACQSATAVGPAGLLVPFVCAPAMLSKSADGHANFGAGSPPYCTTVIIWHFFPCESSCLPLATSKETTAWALAETALSNHPKFPKCVYVCFLNNLESDRYPNWIDVVQ